MVLAATVIFIIGLLDNIIGLSSVFRLLSQLFAVFSLIREEDAEEAGEALERNGYLFFGSGSGTHMNFAADGEKPCFIEVYWDLVNRRNPVQCSLFRPRIAAVWGRSVSVSGRMHMSLEDMVCYLTVHAVKEYFHRPKWLVDIAYVLNIMDERTDADILRGVITEWNESSALGITVEALVRATDDTRYEAACEYGARHPGLLGRFMADRLLRYDDLRGMRPLLWIACAQSPKEVFAVTAGMLRYLMAGR